MSQKQQQRRTSPHDEARKTMGAMRKQFPLGTCGICRNQNRRIVGRLTTDPDRRVCSDCLTSMPPGAVRE